MHTLDTACGPRPWQDIAAEQDGVLSRRQVRLGGHSEDQWQWRVDARRWQSLVPGVVCTHTGSLLLLQQAWAAVLVAGAGACLSGAAAVQQRRVTVADLRLALTGMPRQRAGRPALPASACCGRTTWPSAAVVTGRRCCA